MSLEVDYITITPEMEKLYKLDKVDLPKNFIDNIDFLKEDPSIYNHSYIAYENYENSKLALYIDCKDVLTIEESPKEDEEGFLLVKCKYCKEYFRPTSSAVNNRISALNSNRRGFGEKSLYCSNKCKKDCPTYHAKSNVVYKRDTNYSKQAREIVLELADNQCEICGEENNLEVHHIKPFKTNLLEAYDIDNLVCLCSRCHKEYGHSSKGCRLQDIKNCS